MSLDNIRNSPIIFNCFLHTNQNKDVNVLYSVIFILYIIVILRHIMYV